MASEGTMFLPAVYVKRLRCAPVEEKVLALKELQTLDRKVIELIPKEYKTQIFNQISVFINETVRYGRIPQTMTPLMEAVSDALVLLNDDSFFSFAFKEGNELLEKFAIWLKHLGTALEERLVEKLVRNIAIVTQGIAMVFKPQYLSDMIRMLLEFLSNRPITSDLFIQSTNVLINLCGNSPACYLAVRNEGLLKVVWKKLSENVEKKPVHFRSAFLIHHLMFVLECGVNDGLLEWGSKHVKSYIKNCLLDCEDPKKVAIAKVCMEEVVHFVTTLLMQLKARVDQFSPEEGYNPLDLSPSDEFLTVGSHSKQLMAMITGTTLAYILGRYKDSTKAKILKVHRANVTNLIVALTPGFIPLKDIVPGHKAAFGLIETLLRLDGQENQFQYVSEHTLEALVHLASKVLVEPNPRVRDQFEEEIRFALKCCRLCSNEPNCLRINIASCRIMTMARGFSTLQASLELKLNEDIIRDILESYGTCSNEEFDEKSVCVIEVLGVLADNAHIPKMLELLMHYISLPNTAKHLTKGILSGVEQVINRALTITGSIAFSRNSLSVIVKSLASTAGCGYVAPPANNFEKCMVTPFATKGLAKLDAALEPIMVTYNRQDDGENPSQTLLVQDVVSLYEMKCAAHESEKEVLREQVQEMSRGTEKLKKMLEKQSQLFTERLVDTEKKDRQIQILSHKLQVSNEQLATAKSKIEKELASVTSLLNFKTKTLVNTITELQILAEAHKKLTKEFKELQLKSDKCEALRANAQEIVNNLTKEKTERDKELKDAKEQLLKLDRAVRIKEDERKRFEALLEKEKRTVDTIRGLLGNNIGGAGLS